MTASAKFEFIFTGNSSGLKQAAGDARQELAGVRQEASRTVPAFDAQAEASERAADAARDLVSAVNSGTGIAERNIASLGAAADTTALRMERMVNAFAGITAPAANRNGRADDIAAYGRELERLQARLDPLFAAQTRYHQKLEEINQAERVGAITASSAIDIRLREKNAYDALTESIDRAGRARKAAAEGVVARQMIVPDRGADITAFLDQRDQIRARYDPVFAVLSQYKKSVEDIREANRTGILSEDRMAEAISRRRQAALAAVAQIRGRDTGGGNDREDMFRRQNLTYQLFDVGQTAFMGMNPLMIFAQQGPQIAQMYAGQGGVNAALKDLGSLASGAARAITPLSVSIAGLTAGVAIGAIAYNNYLTSTKAVETAAAGLGRATAGSAAEMERAAQAGAAAANISIASARTMEAQFLRTGRIGSEHFEELIGLSKDFAVTIGIDADQAGDALAKMFADPADAARILHQQYGLIDAATARQATNLARQNRQSEAQAVLLKALPNQLADAERATTALGRAWEFVSTKASNAGSAIGAAIDRAIDGPSLEERIAQAQATRDRMAKSPIAGAFELLSPTGMMAASESMELEALLSEKEIRDYEDAKAKREQDRIRRSQQASSLSQSSSANSSANRRQTLENDITAIENGRDGLTGEDARQADVALEAKRRVLDALINSQHRSAELDRLDIQIQNERNPLLRAELEARRTRLEMSAQEVSTTSIELETARTRNRVIEETIGSAQAQAQDMQSELEIRTRLNSLVASGAVTSTDANRMLREELTLRPLIAAAATAEGEAKTRLQQVIAQLQDGYAALADQERRAGAQEFLRSQNERIEQLRVEQALIGSTDAVRERAMARLEAEQEIRRRGLDANSDLARQMRDQADAAATLNNQIERQADAWGRVQRSAEDAIDGTVDALVDGDFSGALDAFKEAITGFASDEIKANLRNSLLGNNDGTIADIGGLGGIVSRFLGRGNQDPNSIVSKVMGQSVSQATINAGTVIVNGGIGGGLGSMLGAANDNSAGMTSQGGVAGQIWNYFAGKGLKPHQIAGIMGNVSAESAFNPTAVGDGGDALGLFQHNDRAPALLSALGGRGNLGNVQGQLDFAWKELMTSENGAYQRLMASTDVKSATSAFVGFERPQGWSLNNPEASHNFIGRLNGANEALAKFGGTTNVAAQGLGTLGNGFNNFGNSLSQIQPGGGGAGGGGGLSGWLGSLFGGSQWSKAASGSIVGLFDQGGYTGPGGVHEPRGVVHAGEIVWSQRDIARAGGVSTVEAMRLGRRGYDDGGYVSSVAPAYAGVSASMASSRDDRPVLQIVNQTSTSMTGEVEEAGTDERGRRQWRLVMNDAISDAANVPGGSFDRTMNRRYGARRRGIDRG